MSVAIAAVGLCTPLGRTLDELWEAVSQGRDGFIDVDRFELPELPVRFASAFDGPTTEALCREAGQSDPAIAYAVLAGRSALEGVSAEERSKTVLVIATSAGAADTHDIYDRARSASGAVQADQLLGGAFTSLPSIVADALGVTGPRTMVSTACASGGHALGLAIDMLRGGEALRVLVIGADSVHPSLFAGFFSVGALAPRPCCPFGETFGMSLGEGAGALLLESDCADALGYFDGWGGSCDAYHATAPDPRGAGMDRGLRDALHDAGLTAGQVGAFNAHGTGTEANDPAETHAVASVLGDVPMSASKSQLGHTQGAAGVLEALVALAGLRNQAVPPTLRCEPPRRMAPPDPVAGGKARPHAYAHVMSHSAAFGGTNVAVVLGREPHPRPAREDAPIYALGIGACGPFDGSVAAALDPGRASRPGTPGRVRARRADPVTAMLTEAISGAVADAGLVTAEPLDDVALVAGMADGPQLSTRRFVDSRNQRGLAKASAAAFARMVINAPAGAAAAALQLRGLNITLWSGQGAGAQAVLSAARLLRQHETLRAVVAAAADEVGHVTEDRVAVGLLPGEAIAAGGALVLGREPGLARLAESAWGSVAELDALVAAMLARHAVDVAIVSAGLGVEVDLPIATIALDATVGHAASASGVLASTAAVEWIASGSCGGVLVVSVTEAVGCTVLCWVRPDGGKP